MKLYEIESAIMDCLDENGEIIDREQFDLLQIEKSIKIDNIISLYKSKIYEIEAIKKEEEQLLARRKQKEKNAINIKNWIAETLGGEKFETPKHRITWRKSESVELINNELIPNEFKTETTDIQIDKIAIKNALKKGVLIDGARLNVNNNIQIK